jgi:dTDP-4-dehydrorhamnose 3,5-epimerase
VLLLTHYTSSTNEGAAARHLPARKPQPLTSRRKGLEMKVHFTGLHEVLVLEPGCFTEENMIQLYVPVGFGHAFLVLSDTAEVQYKCSGYHAPSAQGTVRWNAPEIDFTWPILNPKLSDRDRAGLTLSEYACQAAFTFRSLNATQAGSLGGAR